MSKIEITNVTDAVFGNCVKMANGIVELLVTVDFGPRVIHFSRVGMENMFHQDREMKPLGEKFPVYGGDIHKTYGGHRVWISPEIMPRCYHPDNKPVAARPVANGMEFTAAVEEKNGIQKVLTVMLSDDSPGVTVINTVKNVGNWDIELAVWCLSVMAPGGKEVVPMPAVKSGLTHNRSISLWEYTEMNDSRIYWGKDYITLRQDPSRENPFKFGINSEEGWAAYFNRGQVFLKYFEPVPDGFYPDNGCSFETYTNGDLLEIETLGELVYLAPGESAEQTEEWELYEESEVPSDCEKEIKEIMDKYIQ